MAQESRRLHSVALFFYSGGFLNFTAEFTKAKLDHKSEWLPLDEIDWLRITYEGIYRGTVYLQTQMEYKRIDDEPEPWDFDEADEWKRSTQDEDEIIHREGLYIFHWKDVEGIRLVFKNADED